MEIQNRTALCFPQLLNSSCKKKIQHGSEAVLLKIMLAFTSLVTVALNLLIITSVSHFRRLHTPTNILLLSLAVSDLLVGLLLMPLEIFRNSPCWIFGDITCLLLCFAACLVPSASIGNIILISADRYVAVCDPLRYPTRITSKRVKCCVCLCWLWSTLYSLFYCRDELIQPGRSNSCTGECSLSINYVTGTVDLFLNFIIPVTIIVILYMRVFVVAVSQARAVRSHITTVTLRPLENSKTKKSELKAARTLGILVITYLVSLCPYYCYSVVEVDLTSTSYASFLFFLFYFNSCLNPLIYALFYSWFRKAVKLIVTLQILQPGSSEANIL